MQRVVRGEYIGFYTIYGKIKVKINADQTKVIGHNVNLVQHFGEATMQAINGYDLPRADYWYALPFSFKFLFFSFANILKMAAVIATMLIFV